MNGAFLIKIAKFRQVGISAAGFMLTGAGIYWLTRYGIKRTINNFTKTIMTEPYERNLMELYSATKRIGFQNVVENNMRAEKGTVIERPLGSPRKFLHFDDLMFNMAQLDKHATEDNVIIDTSVIIGPKAKKPLKVSIPILVGGMANGTALDSKVKVAIARAASAAGTATNTGEAGMHPAERKAAKLLILQLPRASWARDKKTLRKADMIEIQIGQGAYGGVGHITKEKELDKTSRRIMGLKKNQDAVINAIMPELKNQGSLKELVGELKEVTGGVPVGCKIGCGKYLERDLDVAIMSEVDFITLGGAQAGGSGSPPILQDDFGLPTLYALCRSVKYLESKNLKGKVSLIVSGGLFNPGHFLKAIALGADAVYIGTAALYAVSHNQVFQALPFEPPTQVVWYNGVFKKQFNIYEGAKSLEKFLKSCTLEMEDGIKALGKTSIREVNRDDLMALTKEVSEITGVELAY
ncbi:FMN-binding glutamate synthase family protein [Desulfitibacter alkalitolerans]|uniref:FMN-binding glutamate synthase family protein n=1 Tax=Desulfitibacter alkalitolerans TaxID=264641 RepID=UPI000A06E024|nr:FMN-binding glutamate synthase family protein [Desulfitibacter alkalitolerans]